jgi:hypothetical protein
MNLAFLAQRAYEGGLAFLLIGGHAVIAHGYPRNTFDLDLVVPRSVVEGWRALVLALGYTLHGEGATFIQFNPPDAVTLPLDLMIVSETTYRQLEAAAVDAPVSSAGIRMVCLRHLLAFKAHAIRHGHLGRVEKDVADVIGLVRANQLDVAEPNDASCSSSTARPNCMKDSCDSSDRTSPETLDLPAWSAADDRSARVSPDVAFALSERYAVEMLAMVQRWRTQRRTPCPVEFVLD